MKYLMLLATLPLAALAAPQPPDGITHVEVGGHMYRVTVRGQVVRSTSMRRVWSGETVEERDAQRAAVEKATGCRIVDEIDMNGAPKILGKLDCSRQTPAK